jgi:hypothetical protein
MEDRTIWDQFVEYARTINAREKNHDLIRPTVLEKRAVAEFMRKMSATMSVSEGKKIIAERDGLKLEVAGLNDSINRACHQNTTLLNLLKNTIDDMSYQNSILQQKLEKYEGVRCNYEAT